MKRNGLIFIFGLLITFNSNILFAQKPAFQIGKHIPPAEAKKKRNNFSELIAASDDEFLVADRTRKGQVYTSYNSESLQKKETFTLDYPEVNGGKDANWVKRIFRSEETTSIYGYYDRKEDQNTVYGKITDRNGKEIVKEKVLARISASKKKYVGNLGQVLSKDQSKILIYREVTAKESEQEEIELWLYDDQLNKIYKKTMNFPYKNKQFRIQEFLVTNEGKVIIIASWIPTKADKDSKDMLSFMVFGLTEDKEELEEIKITKKGSALSSAYGWVLDSGAVVFTGYYREGGDKKYRYGANGIYYVKVNTNNWDVETSHFSKIPKDDLARVFANGSTSEKKKRRAEAAADRGAGLSSFYLRGLFFDEDGSVKIISQVEYMIQNCTTDPKTHVTTCTYTYYNMQVVEFDLDQEGNIIRTIVIPKSQIAGTPAYQGHIALLSDSRTYFIYNDADRNFNEKKVAKNGGNKFAYTFGNIKHARLAYVYSKKSGDLAKVAMTADPKSNILIFPYTRLRVNRSTVIAWGRVRKGKELVLVKFYLKKKEKE